MFRGGSGGRIPPQPCATHGPSRSDALQSAGPQHHGILEKRGPRSKQEIFGTCFPLFRHLEQSWFALPVAFIPPCVLYPFFSPLTAQVIPLRPKDFSLLHLLAEAVSLASCCPPRLHKNQVRIRAIVTAALRILAGNSGRGKGFFSPLFFFYHLHKRGIFLP